MLRHLQTPKLHSPSSNLRLSKKVLDFRIQISSDSKSLGIPVRGQKTAHLVIRQMHAVWPFIHQYRDRGVRSGIRNVLCHFLHDERIANTLSSSVKFRAPLVAFANSTISGRPTATRSAATTASNGLEEITLNRSILTFLIVMFPLLGCRLKGQ